MELLVVVAGAVAWAVAWSVLYSWYANGKYSVVITDLEADALRWEHDVERQTYLFERAITDRDAQKVAATQWGEQAKVLSAQNDRLLDELAAARLEAGQSARDILAAFTTAPTQDGPPPVDGFDPTLSSQAAVDQALLDAAGAADWTDGDGWIGVRSDPTQPPAFVADIAAAEDHQ